MVAKKLNISIADRELFEMIKSGDENAILRGLSHPGAIYRVNAAINAVRFEVKKFQVKVYLDRMKADNVVVNGYRVSEFAYAALDLLGMERYSGNEPKTKALIKSKFDFYN